MYAIKLFDGTVIDGLTINGNHFISETPVEQKVFARNLSRVEITSNNLPDMDKFNTDEPVDWSQYDSPEFIGVFDNMKLTVFVTHGTGTWFVLAKQTEQELMLASLRADTDYLLMMEEG